MIQIENNKTTAMEAARILGLSKANADTLTHVDVMCCPNDVCIETISGRNIPCVVATIVESDEYITLSYNKLLKFFESKGWNFDVPMIFNTKEYNDFKIARRRR